MTTQSQGSGAVGGVLAAAGLGLVISLAVALMNLMTEGHASFNSASNGVTWGLPVVNYVFFALTSTGLTLVASLALVFGMKEFYPIAKRCVWGALVTLIIGFISLGLEIGNPIRMLWAIPTNMAVSSPMWWMGVLYGGYLFLLMIEVWSMFRGHERIHNFSCLLASFMAILAPSTLGAVFDTPVKGVRGYASYATNAKINFDTTRDIYNEPLPPGRGVSKDIGLKFGRGEYGLSGNINYYVSEAQNFTATLGGIGQAGMFRQICGLYRNGGETPGELLNGGLVPQVVARLGTTPQRVGKTHRAWLH